jgi:hypothetical protein
MPGCAIKRIFTLLLCLSVLPLVLGVSAQTVQRVGGTLVVAVPVREGLVVCSDKRLYNEATGVSRDDFVKIHPAGDKALFVATHTTGFLNKTTGKMEFDVFDLTQAFVTRRGFHPDRAYWVSLRDEIRSRLSAYLLKQKYQDLPETDLANSRLLFNLVFFSVDVDVAKDYSLSVFYEKARTPVIDVGNVVTETVRNPKLLGKGKDVMALLARDPALSTDPSILRFDQSYFKAERTSPLDAVNFARRLFALTNATLPGAEVSSAHDCALLSDQNGFDWLDTSAKPVDR